MFAATCGLTADRITAASPQNERTISFFHIHTQETLTVTYKRDGKFIPEAMKKIDWLMRDWRKNETIRMDPNTVDLIWEMHEELGSKEPVNVICGYRSRGTNEMLRRTVGGQASQSQHITGKAIDITFPDVPLKRMRYSALIRERGGVGYYPTSGIPFVHVDTSRVRAWPRLPRYELALLFPNGHTQHQPATGGPITTDDARVARAKYRDLAVQIADFQDLRRAPRPATTLVASAEPAAPAAAPRPANQRGFALASLGPENLPWTSPKAAAKPGAKTVSFEPIPANELPAQPRVAAIMPADAPELVNKPKLIDRSSRFEAREASKAAVARAPTNKERTQLAALVAQAEVDAPKLLAAPKPAVRPAKALAAVALAPQAAELAQSNAKGPRVAALIPPAEENGTITDMSPDSLGNGWVQAPEFDEDHPEELAYRPFPLAPLLTDSPNASEPLFGGLQHPDVAQTLETIDDVGAVLPMRFRPGQQVAQVMWAQQFQGKAVHLDALKELDESRASTGISERPVQTSTKTQ